MPHNTIINVKALLIFLVAIAVVLIVAKTMSKDIL